MSRARENSPNHPTEDPGEGAAMRLTEAQQRVVEHRGDPLLVTGRAGSGRTEALAARVAGLVVEGADPDGILVVSSTRAGALTLRERIDPRLADGHVEIRVHTFGELAEMLLRSYAVEANVDPFFTTVTRADRLAIMLDHLDDLVLRRHEIRGNPAGLLARLLRRIDTFKEEMVSPARLREWAERQGRAAEDPAEREKARREWEFAGVYERHDRILADLGAFDGGELVLAAERLLVERGDVAAELPARFPHMIVDELEEAGRARRVLLRRMAADAEVDIAVACDKMRMLRQVAAADGHAANLAEESREIIEIELEGAQRFGPDIAAATAVALPAAGGDTATPALTASREIDSKVRLWRCEGERGQAQAVAREIERLLAGGEVRAERVCVVVGGGWREGRVVAAAMEERNLPFRFAGESSFFGRPEVRDVLAWLRMLADAGDAAAVVRCLTRPPVELRSIDLARLTTISKRRKLDMVLALEAALESPQLPPEARDKISSFLKLRKAAAAALEEMTPDVFVRRLVERVGLRRQQLFAASPETAERLVSLSRLAEMASEWSRRQPRGSTRDFIRHISAIADSGALGLDDAPTPSPGRVMVAEPAQVKGLEFDHVYFIGLDHESLPVRAGSDISIPEGLCEEAGLIAHRDPIEVRRQLAYLVMSRARRSLVLAWPAESGRTAPLPAALYTEVSEALGAEEEIYTEELFGPAESLHSTFRILRDEVLEMAWRAGSALSEMRLDTTEDVNRAVARYLELVKLAALIQRPGEEPVDESLTTLGDLLARVTTPDQQAALEDSVLDEFVVGEQRVRKRRRSRADAHHEPSLAQFLPRSGDGLALSATDITLYRGCPLKYKFARVFSIPTASTINLRFGILMHNVLQKFHAEELWRGPGTPPRDPAVRDEAGLGRLLSLFESGWRRSGFGTSNDELQYRDRGVAALASYHDRHVASESRPEWLERGFSFRIGPHQLRGRVDRVDRLGDNSLQVIDYKTGSAPPAFDPNEDIQLALYRLGIREAWQVEIDSGSYWYVLDDERVIVPADPAADTRVENTVLEVAEGIEAQDFEPRPSQFLCGACDFRLICPASEA